MFKNEDILEFMTRMVKNSNSNNIETSKESIEKFKEYLMYTTMCDESTLNSITNVVNCFEELVNIYEKIGICDLSAIFNQKVVNVEKADLGEDKVNVQVRRRTFDKPYQEKHYDRYIPISSDNSLGDFYDSTCSSRSYGTKC